MPIVIKKDDSAEEAAFLCDDTWELPAQIDILEGWLIENENKMESGKYTADIGYSPRDGAAGGGTAISLKAMSILMKMGMVLYLSEYPKFIDSEDSDKSCSKPPHWV